MTWIVSMIEWGIIGSVLGLRVGSDPKSDPDQRIISASPESLPGTVSASPDTMFLPSDPARFTSSTSVTAPTVRHVSSDPTVSAALPGTAAQFRPSNVNDLLSQRMKEGEEGCFRYLSS